MVFWVLVEFSLLFFRAVGSGRIGGCLGWRWQLSALRFFGRGEHHCVRDATGHGGREIERCRSFEERCVRHSSHLRIEGTGLSEVFDAASLCVDTYMADECK